MGIFSRIFGIPKTKPPQDPRCWQYSDGRLTVDLGRAGELSEKGGAVRIEGGGLPHRVLVIHGRDDNFHAFINRCTHAGRRLDPLPGRSEVQCCSVGKSTFDYQGDLMGGSAKEPIKTLALENKDGRLVVKLG